MFRSNTLWTEPLLSVSQKVTLSIVILVGARPFALVTLILTGTTFPTAPQYSFVKDKPINSCSALSAFSWKARDTSNDVGHPLLFSSLVWQIWWAGVHSVFVQDPESHCNSCTSNRRIQVNLRAANIHQILQQTNTHTRFTTSKSDHNQKKVFLHCLYNIWLSITNGPSPHPQHCVLFLVTRRGLVKIE